MPKFMSTERKVQAVYELSLIRPELAKELREHFDAENAQHMKLNEDLQRVLDYLDEGKTQ